MSPTGRKQIAAYIKFIFIWETFLNNWQCLVLQQVKVTKFSFEPVLLRLTLIPRKNKKYFSVKKKSTLYMQIHTQTQVAGNLFYHLNVNWLHWFPKHIFRCMVPHSQVRFKIKYYNVLTTVWTALVVCGRNELLSCLNTIIWIITKIYIYKTFSNKDEIVNERHNPGGMEEGWGTASA